MMIKNQPIPLDHAGAWRVYLGGQRIRRLRGLQDAEDNHFPEEWIASVTEAAGAGAVPGAGLSHLRHAPEWTLRDLIAADPPRFLGERFVQRHGNSCGVLLKLLDAAERLNVQVHPSREDAMRLWGLPFGKTECWHFLESRQVDGHPPVFYLGLRPEISADILRRAFESGESERILDCMHCFPVRAGETVLVGSGVPHAIGAGCFLLEIQEPTDLTLRLERTTASGSRVPDEICHMGAGYDAMFSLIQCPGLSREETRARWFLPSNPLASTEGGRITRLLDYSRCPYFAMDRMEVWGVLRLPQESVFCGLFVLSGAGELLSGSFRSSLKAGDQLFIPAGCPALEFKADGALQLIRFFGPQA